MAKYKNKYRIESNRMPVWDYSGNGKYFITMVTNHRICWFGKIINNKMILSEFGRIVKTEFYKSFKIRQELILDEFVIMPNHIHAIIVLKKIGLQDFRDSPVETHGRASLHAATNQTTNQSNHPQKQPILYRKPKSISSFMAGYKSAVTTIIDDYIDLHHLDVEKFNRKNRLWQVNYNDHVIRNENEYLRIKKYIINNPENWNNDNFYGNK